MSYLRAPVVTFGAPRLVPFYAMLSNIQALA